MERNFQVVDLVDSSTGRYLGKAVYCAERKECPLWTFDYNRTHGRLCENTDFTSQSTFSLKQTTQIEKRSNYNSKGLWVKMSQKICGGEGGNLIRKTLLNTIQNKIAMT